MPSMLCLCDNVIKYSEIPNPDEWLIISDVDFDNFSGLVNAEDIYDKMRHILKCNRCGRLWIFWEGFSHRPTSYIAEILEK